jgi:hypothetical protein
VAAARTRVVAAQSQVDEFRIGLVCEHAAAWREHAARVREGAAAAGDETTVVSVAVQGNLDGASVEPQLRYKRVVLAEEAAQAEARAAHLQGYLQRGDALAGESLAVLVGQFGAVAGGCGDCCGVAVTSSKVPFSAEQQLQVANEILTVAVVRSWCRLTRLWRRYAPRLVSVWGCWRWLRNSALLGLNCATC